MYDFVTGPLLWLSLIIFFVGLILRTVYYIKGLDTFLDRVTYGVNTAYGVKGAIKSILHWIIPFGSRSWRVKPIFTILVFVFHIGLVITPIFLLAHNLILEERWGFRLPTISDTAADIMTIAVIVSAIFLIIRRIALPEVRILTSAYDYLIMLITVAPFITGFISFHQVSDYQFWVILHILCGEIMLIAIPFTKLSHIVLFFMSRIQIGMDFGIKRGGMKGGGKTW